MKFLLLSDTHNQHKKIPTDWFIPADAIIHAGDLTAYGRLEELEDFFKWYSSLDYEYKIFIAGNHDWGFMEKYEDVMKILDEKYPTITYLQDDFVIIEGIKIYGSPWQPRFYDWAFNMDRGEKIKEKWDLIPSDTHILITHGPANGILDTTPYGDSAGCVDLLNTINERLTELKLFVSGHIHCASGIEVVNDVIYVNAAILNESYFVNQKPRLIEINNDKGE